METQACQSGLQVPQAPREAEFAPVVGIGDHAVAVEHARDVLLGPVPSRQLGLEQVQGSSAEGLGVQGMLPCQHQRQHGPGGVDHMARPLQLAVHLLACTPRLQRLLPS